MYLLWALAWAKEASDLGMAPRGTLATGCAERGVDTKLGGARGDVGETTTSTATKETNLGRGELDRVGRELGDLIQRTIEEDAVDVVGVEVGNVGALDEGGGTNDGLTIEGSICPKSQHVEYERGRCGCTYCSQFQWT